MTETITEPATVPVAQLTAMLQAEITYQSLRAELAAAEQGRYRSIYDALAASADPATLLAATPTTITRATVAAAIRRYAPPADWAQLALFEFEQAGPGA